MASRLVDRLSSRFIFVVGKGGVGKTTTSAALALAMADAGRATHLISTDPAHSLGDVFDQPLGSGEPSPSPCSPKLTLEEFNAADKARHWFGEVGEAVAELVDRGTYLDRDDVVGLLDRSLPGMDEVMAALRISELSDTPEHDVVVVDTAPTGHTLRLLDCGEVLRGWVTALAAMSDKAAAVGAGMTGRRVRFAGDRVMERLASDVERFTNGILQEADFVVVTREGEVVTAETERLIAELKERGVRVAALVAVGGGATTDYEVPVMEIPLRTDLIGCDGVRRWGATPAKVIDPLAKALASAGPTPSIRPGALERLPHRELMLFAGKGGVGKSTCAAAFAVSRSERHRVLLLSLDPAGSLGEVLGEPVGPEGTVLGSNLVARQLDAQARFAAFRKTYHDQVREVFRRLGLHQSASLDRRVLETVLEMAPSGVDEIFAVEAILDAAGDHDVLVLDTAPTGHFLRLIEMPELARSWMRAVLRVLLKYRAVLGLDDFAKDVLQLAKRLGGLIELLADPERTGVVVVTQADALSHLESERLLATLTRGRSPILALIQNRWTSAEPPGHFTSAGEDGKGYLRILAPLLSPSPVGPDRLRDFARRWATL